MILDGADRDHPAPVATCEVSLTDIRPPRGQGSVTVDDRAKKEQRDLSKERERAELKSLRQDIEQRARYARQIFRLICTWLVALLGVLVFQGFGLSGFKLSDSVLMTLIGGSTGSVLGLFLVVVRYLFPNRAGTAGEA